MINEPSRTIILLMGILATLGGLLGVAADYYSVVSPHAGSMEGAFAVGLSDVIRIMAAKPPSEVLIGSYLGQYFIPLHGLAFFLIYLALRPASPIWAGLAVGMSFYILIIGTSVHASLVYVAAIGRVDDPAITETVAPFFDFAAYSMIVGILFVTTTFAALILTGKTKFPRWVALVSPLSYMMIASLFVAMLGDRFEMLRAFLTATSFNLPFAVFSAITTVFLLHGSERQTNR